MKRLGDPFVSSVFVFSALVLAGLGALGLSWRGVAAQTSVAEQVPYAVSGGIGGLALVAFSAGLLVLQSRRFAEARRRSDLEVVVEAATALLIELRDREGAAG